MLQVLRVQLQIVPFGSSGDKKFAPGPESQPCYYLQIYSLVDELLFQSGYHVFHNLYNKSKSFARSLKE